MADRRVTIVSPRDRAIVRLPVRVRWTVRDFAVTGRTGTTGKNSGYFGVFVDRAPVPPGETLASLARDDRLCRATPGCPDEAFLAARNAHDTTEPTLVLERLPDLTRGERRDFHSVTVVFLDGKGRRIGESAFSVEFQVDRK